MIVTFVPETLVNAAGVTVEGAVFVIVILLAAFVILIPVPAVAATNALLEPFKTPLIDVVRVKDGVAPPLEVPANPLAEATDTEVTVPDPLLLKVVQSVLDK